MEKNDYRVRLAIAALAVVFVVGSAAYALVSDTHEAEAQVAGSAVSGPVLLKLVGTSIQPANAAWHIAGSAAAQTPWLANIDGAGHNLTNAGSITMTNFAATSTTATSSVTNSLLIGTSTDFSRTGIAGRLEINDTSGSMGDSYGMLYIHSTDPSGGNFDIHVESPNPDIEFTETDQVSPAGKYEMALNNDKWQINSRNSSNTSFEPVITFGPYRTGRLLGVGTQFDTPDAVFELVATSTIDAFDITSVAGHAGGNQGDYLTMLANGNLGLGTTTPGSLLSLQGIANFSTGTSTLYSQLNFLTPGSNMSCILFNGACGTKRWLTGYFGGDTVVSNSQTMTANVFVHTEVNVPTELIVDQMCYTVGGTSSGNVQLAIYGPVVTPDTIVGAPFVASTTSTGQSTINTGQCISIGPIALKPGNYYMGIQGDNSVGSYMRETNQSQITPTVPINGTFSTAYGSLPTATATTTTSVNSGIPGIRLRVVPQ